MFLDSINVLLHLFKTIVPSCLQRALERSTLLSRVSFLVGWKEVLWFCLGNGENRAWIILFRKRLLMLLANRWTEHKVPNDGARERTEGAEGACSPIGRITIWTNQYPQSSQGLNQQPKSTHGGTHSSSCICSRGWPCGTSMGGEYLGPVKARCPSVGECQDRESGVGGVVSRGRG